MPLESAQGPLKAGSLRPDDFDETAHETVALTVAQGIQGARTSSCPVCVHLALSHVCAKLVILPRTNTLRLTLILDLSGPPPGWAAQATGPAGPAAATPGRPPSAVGEQAATYYIRDPGCLVERVLDLRQRAPEPTDAGCATTSTGIVAGHAAEDRIRLRRV